MEMVLKRDTNHREGVSGVTECVHRGKTLHASQGAGSKMLVIHGGSAAFLMQFILFYILFIFILLYFLKQI